MCRLLGFCSGASASVAELLGECGLAEFTRLSAYHRHGWGVAWYPDSSGAASRQPQASKSALPAIDDPAYPGLTHSQAGGLGLVHLRRATPGLPVVPANSHPFVRGGFAMAHNGAIQPQDRLGELLDPEWERQLTGDTDTERYFLRMMASLEANGGDVVGAIAETAAHIDREFTVSSLNAILLSPDALYAVCWYDPDRIPSGAAAQLGYAGPAERYFDLAYRQDPGAVVVASAGWPQPGWSTLPNRHVLVADRATLRVTVLPLDPPGARDLTLSCEPAAPSAPRG